MITKVRSCKIFLKYRISGFRGGIKPRDPDILLYKSRRGKNYAILWLCGLRNTRSDTEITEGEKNIEKL
jgi:hypothetical protein